MAKQKQGTCVYCGQFKDMTDDHVPPQNLYSPAERARVQMHTVSACDDCNNGASVDDEVFKMVVLFEAAESRQDEAALIDKMAGTIRANQKMARGFFPSVQKVRKDGVEMVAAEFDGAAYSRVVGRIARALYFKEKGASLPLSTPVIGRAANAVEQTEAVRRVALEPQKFLNGGMFNYRVSWEADGTSVWRLEFFGKHVAYALIAGDR